MGRERSAFHPGPETFHSNQGRIHERRPTLSLSFFACNSAADHTSPYGPSILNWLPLPNTFGQPSYNYQSQVPSAQPSYDQIYRVDYNLNDKWRFFVRGLDNKQTQNVPYGRADTSNLLALTPFYAPTYGGSITTDVATIITPTLFHEFPFGYTVNGM